MNLDISTMVRPEILPIIVGGIYVLALVPVRQISFSKILLSALVLLTLVPFDTSIYSFILAATYIVQAFIFMNTKERMNSYKYFLLSFVVTTVNLAPLLPHHNIFFLVLALGYVLLLSEKNDIRNPYIYISNIVILAGLVLRVDEIPNKDLVSTMVIISLLTACLRMFLGRISTLLFIMPLFLIGAVLSDRVVFFAIFIYILYFSMISNFQKQKLILMILSLLPFLDGSVFNRLYMDVASKNILLDVSYLPWIIATLLSVCAAKALETELEKRQLQFNYQSVLLLLIPMFLIASGSMQEEQFMVSLPVPLLATILFIVLEARYLAIFKRVSLDLSFNVVDPVLYPLRWTSASLKKIKFRNTKTEITTMINIVDSKIRTADHTALFVIAVLAAIALIIYYGGLA